MTYYVKNLKKLTALLLVAVLLILPACKKDTGIDRNFYYPITANAQRLDPQIAYGSTEDIILYNCMEGLVRIAGDGTVIPGVAESWKISSDGKTYTFKLREDAKWFASAAFHNKIPKGFFEDFDNSVTANDFVYAFRRAVTPLIASPLAEKLDQIQNARAIRLGKSKPENLGVRAIDKYTLRITLAEPDSQFLLSLAFAPFYPCSQIFFEATQGRYGLEPEYLLSNGPFYLARWHESSSSVLLRRNPDYAGQEPVLPASVTLQIDSNPQQYSARLASGAYSACPLISAADLPSGSQLISIENRMTALVFNCGNGLMKRPAVRSALTGVLDLTKIAGDDHELALGLIPNSAILGDESYRIKADNASFAKMDVKKARSALASELSSAGVSALEITILCPPEFESAVRQILQQWNAGFGLLVKTGVEILPEQTIEARGSRGDFTAAILPLSLHGQSPLGFLSQFAKDSPANIPRYSSSSYDKLLNSLRGANSAKSELSAARKAENHLLQNGVCLPLFNAQSVFAVGRNVSGLEFPLGMLPDFRSALMFG